MSVRRFRGKKKKTVEQVRKIWALAREMGLSEEELRDVVERVTGQRRISVLTKRQANRVISRLIDIKTGGAIRERQLRKIEELRRELGWSKEGMRLWLEHNFKVSAPQWLTKEQATRVIGALINVKKYYERKRDEVARED